MWVFGESLLTLVFPSPICPNPVRARKGNSTEGCRPLPLPPCPASVLLSGFWWVEPHLGALEFPAKVVDLSPKEPLGRHRGAHL